MLVEFKAVGKTAAQGSKRFAGRNCKTGNPLMLDTDPNLRPWRELVAVEALRARGSNPPYDGAVVLHADFHILKPKSVKRKYPSVPKDLDKLLRALCDGITSSGVWRDDAQVVSVIAHKVYSDWEGVDVTVESME